MAESNDILEQQKVYDFLKVNSIAILATITPDNKPYATTIYFSLDTDLSVRFISKKGTQKIQNIEKNNNIVLVVFDSITQTNVQIFGKAEDISDEKDAGEVFKKVLEVTRQTSQAEVPPVSKLFADNYVAYKVKPKQIRFSVYQPEAAPSTETQFITLDF